MPKADADRNLLFGILAVQMDFTTRDALIAAMNAWVLDKQKSLGQILLDQGALAREAHDILEILLQQHLKQHDNDPAKSLLAISTIGSVRKDLERVADPDVQASLAAASAARAADDDPYATRSSAGHDDGASPRFRILRPHARGGLGEVFVAHDQDLNRKVALKEIQDKHADRPESRSRFLLEAEITGALEHPGIVPVYALGQDLTGRPYYVMRFIQGDNLTSALHRFHRAEDQDGDPGGRALAFRKLLGRFVDVCNAMAYAHSKGVLHRDLKPDNIMLGKYGETLVVDWGLAKAAGQTDPSAPADEEPVHPASGGSGVETLPGRAFGTPQFMSPEQAAGELERMGPASDVYSLGATLYPVLTGRLAFEDRDPGAVIQKVLKGEFPHPRQVNRQVHRALEAVCLKAMALKTEDRYGSPRALADDIERWLADEPVSAWREPWMVRARRWMARHRTLVTSTAAALLVGLAAVGYLLYEARLRAAQRQTRAEGLVTALTTAATREVPRILEPLQPDRPLVRSRLRTLADDPRGAPRERLHAALALLPDEPARADALTQTMIDGETSPEVLIVIRQALSGHARALTPRLWVALERKDEQALTSQQLRAAASLAAFNPDDARWETIRFPVAARLVQENPLLIGAWREAFQKIGGRLAEPMRAIYADRTRPEPRALAFSLLFDLANDTGDLAELIADADPDQFRHVIGRLSQDRARAVALLAPKLDPPAQFDEIWARRQGQIATALVLLGQADRAWPLLKHTDDPSLRSELIHALALFGADPHLIVERLGAERDVSARRALLLALGEYYPVARIAVADRQDLAATLLKWYADDPDPGVHGGIDWLLRQRWALGADLDRIDQRLASPNLPKDRDWYVNGQGLSFAVVRGPVEFWMGSPENEPNREPIETRCRVRIGRSFAIATREVTLVQYQRFLDANPDVLNLPGDERVKASAPFPDCPILAADWYDAAHYCNWLSAQEGIPESQWCYPREIKAAMKLPSDYLSRTGYRLPTEAEWEYACRSGSLTSRPYGSIESLLGQYAWSVENARNTSHSAGQKKPNDLGLFDILGNAWEWCHDPFERYQADAGGRPRMDTELDVTVSDTNVRVLRGGSIYSQAAAYLRSAGRNPFRPSDRYYAHGFRVSRTCP